jgi:hypothetical protein
MHRQKRYDPHVNSWMGALCVSRLVKAEGLARWLPEAKWEINQVKAAGMWSEAVL